MTTRTSSVLVVEDDPIVSYVVVQALEEVSDGVHLAPDGATAIRMLAERGFDAVVTDLRMPGVGGLDVARQARARLPNVRIVVISGYTSPEDERHIAEAGASLLRKPFGTRELLDALAPNP